MAGKLKHYLAESALLGTTVIWGGTFALIKSALGFISPMAFIASRFTIASVVLLPFVFKKFRTATAKHWKQALILGLIYAFSFAMQTLGLKHTTATKSAFITGLFVIFTPIFQTMLERRLPGIPNIIAIILAVFGVAFLSGKGGTLSEVFYSVGANFTIGDFFTLLCAITYAAYIVYLDMISSDIDWMFLTYVQIALTAIIGIIAAGEFHAADIETVFIVPAFELIRAIAYTALVATIITTILQTKFQKEVSPTRASIIFSMEPIFAATFAFFILSERISLIGVFGAALIVSGLLISELFSKD